MLAPLDNVTILKKAFTDKVVFQQFVNERSSVDIKAKRQVLLFF